MGLTAPINTRFAFASLFNDYGRGNQFTYQGFDALYWYFSDLSDDLGEDISIDVVAICCEWTEYDSLKELADAYGIDKSMSDTDVRDGLSDIGTCLKTEGGTYLFSE